MVIILRTTCDPTIKRFSANCNFFIIVKHIKIIFHKDFSAIMLGTWEHFEFLL